MIYQPLNHLAALADMHARRCVPTDIGAAWAPICWKIGFEIRLSDSCRGRLSLGVPKRRKTFLYWHDVSS